MSNLEPFQISIDRAAIERIHRGIREFRWEALADAGGWQCGASVAYVRKLCDYWLNEYDWRAVERELNRFPQFLATIDGTAIHFYHVKHPTRRPALVLIHGWPGSVFEFLRAIEPLAYPERFGGNAADGFDVIVPSLPGFGFSGRPREPIGPRIVAGKFNELLTQLLGYKSYIAQGGDWGAGVSAWLAFDHSPACRGLHLNMQMVQAEQRPETDEEKAWQQRSMEIFAQEGAYFRQQSTKPQTLAFAMLDNPVGTAAWIVEKFAAWSDLERLSDGSPDMSRYRLDDLITNLMFYVATDSFATSAWIYYGWMQNDGPRTFPSGRRCETPTGFASFPDPCYPSPPRSWIEKSYNLIHYTSMARGGHFAAFEQPQLFVDDVRKFVRML